MADGIKLLQDTPFTVKGGGHGHFAGASSVDKGGVTIDLKYLNSITVAPDRKTVSVGAGNRWINVSEALDPLGLAVVGGRAAGVGVGGVILGGGISFFSGKYGWACDNVRNFEVVLASGEMVNASPKQNKDLYWALRGGAGNNFGIVTRFDLKSFEHQGELWSQQIIAPGTDNQTAIALFHNLTVHGMPADNEAHGWLVLSHMPDLGGYVVLQDQFRFTPQLPDPTVVPPAFQPFEELNIFYRDVANRNISAQSRIVDATPAGFREGWWNTAVSVRGSEGARLLQDVALLWEKYNQQLIDIREGEDGDTLSNYLIFQAIPANAIAAMQVDGGNALGITPADGPLMIVQLSTTWSNPAHDGLVESIAERIIGEVEAMAKKRRLDNGFVYLNYAGPGQREVFERYGKKNAERLRKIAKRYDPRGVLKRRWRGYFKV